MRKRDISERVCGGEGEIATGQPPTHPAKSSRNINLAPSGRNAGMPRTWFSLALSSCSRITLNSSVLDQRRIADLPLLENFGAKEVSGQSFLSQPRTRNVAPIFPVRRLV